MHNFHLTIEDYINDDNDKNAFSHICLLFTGKLTYFGTPLWEEHCLTYYKYALEQLDRQNVKVTAKFIVYDVDEHLPGNFANLLSGYGNIYSLLFDNITDSEVIYPNRSNQQFKKDIDKYNNIYDWFVHDGVDTCNIKKHYFESYCKSVFDFIAEHSFYYVNSEYTLTKIRKVLANDKINGVYAFGQHFQVNNAYENYPNMFDDCDKNTLIFKLRYDGLYSKCYESKFGSLKNAFHNACNNWVISETIPYKFNYDYNDYPTVMFTRMYFLNTVRINFSPNDITFVFNSAGIKTYAEKYTDWLLDTATKTFNPNNDPDKENHFVGLNIHSSIGLFFLHNHFNTLDYSPNISNYRNIFGAPLRTMSTEQCVTIGDIHDDYKIRWYDKQEDIKQMIIDKFGKHDNT
jgi:hypothetical protein